MWFVCAIISDHQSTFNWAVARGTNSTITHLLFYSKHLHTHILLTSCHIQYVCASQRHTKQFANLRPEGFLNFGHFFGKSSNSYIMWAPGRHRSCLSHPLEAWVHPEILHFPLTSWLVPSRITHGCNMLNCGHLSSCESVSSHWARFLHTTTGAAITLGC